MIKIYTDGACKVHGTKNGGWAYALIRDEVYMGIWSGMGTDTTNQRMEMYAVITALHNIGTEENVYIYSDSAYIVNCINQGWYKKWQQNGWKTGQHYPVRNQDLWEELIAEYEKHKVTFVHIRGHGKNTDEMHNKYNDMVDRAANKAIPL